MTGPPLALMARDAGPAAALAAVGRRCVDERLHGVAVFATGQGVAPFVAEGLPVLAAPEDPGPAAVAQMLRRAGSRAVVTGTSADPAADAAWWEGARAAGLSPVALLDHWRNYSGRFSVDAPYDALPDALAVMDDEAARGLEADGCPSEVIHVTGQPYLDPTVVRERLVDRELARAELGLDPGRRVVVFASEPKASREHEVLSALLTATGDAQVVVKLHPLEDPFEFVRAAGPLEARVVSAYSPWRLVSAADVVVGMTSILLLQAAVAGVPAISFRPGEQADGYVAHHAGLIADVTDAAALAAALGAERGPAVAAPFADGAVDRLLSLVDRVAA